MNIKLKLQVKVSGEGSPLLLVPGGLTGWKSWEPFVDTFTAMHRKVMRVQLLSVQYGVGNRQLPVGYSVKTESNALASMLQSLGHSGPVDIVGWSFGGFVSLEYALDHPETVRTLTLIEPPAIWVLRESGSLDTEAQHMLNFFNSLHGDITGDMLDSFLQVVGLVKPGDSPRDLPQWAYWLTFRNSLRNCPAIVSQNGKLKRLNDFNRPVLLVKGSGSAPFLHKIIDLLSVGLPDSRVIELPGGHAPQLVSREKFLFELKSFQENSVKILH